MNKVELINAVAEKAGMTKVDARKAIDAIMDVTKAELKKDGKIALVGFGTMSVAKREARKGRNPKTGKTINIKAKKVVKFKPAANILKK
jgi:DNA-binding protein HU-beta